MSNEAHETGPRGGGGRLGAVRAWGIWWVLCAALWLALVDRSALASLLTGALAAALGATAAVLVRQQRGAVIRPRARWLATAGKRLFALLRDLWPLTRALIGRGVLRRDERGAIHALPFDAVGDDPRDVAFRVLTAGVGSLGPNTIVLDVDVDERVLYAHQLVATDDPGASAMPLERP